MKITKIIIGATSIMLLNSCSPEEMFRFAGNPGKAAMGGYIDHEVNKYGSNEIAKSEITTKQYNDAIDQRVSEYFSEVDQFKKNYCITHGFVDIWENKYGEDWYEKAGKQWFDDQNNLRIKRGEEELLPWHLRESAGEVMSRANNMKQESLENTLLGCVGATIDDVNRFKKWKASDKYGKQDMVIDAAFDAVSEDRDNKDFIEAMRQLMKINNNYMRNRRREESDQAMSQMTLELMNLVYESSLIADEKKKLYLAEKMDIERQLTDVLGYANTKLTTETAGIIMSIIHDKNMSEQEKDEWLRRIGYLEGETDVKELVSEIDNMDDSTILEKLDSIKNQANNTNKATVEKRVEEKQMEEKRTDINLVNNMIADSYLFDVTTLNDEQKDKLNFIASILGKYPDLTITIVGHTCNIGTESVNNSIGLKRANEAKQYLVSTGVDAKRINLETKGESEPIMDNDSKENRKHNRRITFIINE